MLIRNAWPDLFIRLFHSVTVITFWLCCLSPLLCTTDTAVFSPCRLLHVHCAIQMIVIIKLRWVCISSFSLCLVERPRVFIDMNSFAIFMVVHRVVIRKLRREDSTKGGTSSPWTGMRPTPG